MSTFPFYSLHVNRVKDRITMWRVELWGRPDCERFTDYIMACVASRKRFRTRLVSFLFLVFSLLLWRVFCLCLCPTQKMPSAAVPRRDAASGRSLRPFQVRTTGLNEETVKESNSSYMNRLIQYCLLNCFYTACYRSYFRYFIYSSYIYCPAMYAKLLT